MKPYYDNGQQVIYHADCREVLPHLPKVDLVLTDPPYGLGDRLKSGELGEWSKGFATAPGWDKSIADDRFVCKLPDMALAVIWGGNYYSLPPCRGWLSWDKCQEHSSGHFEMAWTNLDIPTRSFKMSRVEAYSQMGKEHPTQKPLELMLWCIGLSKTNGTILDPFMGSGTTLVASKLLDRKAIGIEIEEKYCEIAARRLEDTTPSLFAEGA